LARDVITGLTPYVYGSLSFSADRFGSLGSAYDVVNPVSNYMIAASDVYFRAEFSITAWVLLTSSRTLTVVSFDGAKLELNVASDSVVLVTGDSNGLDSQCVASTVSLTLHAWHHVACVMRGSNGTSYLNGVEIAACQGMRVPPAATSITAYIGTKMASQGSGSIDQLKIFSRALSAQEVSADFASTGSVSFFKHAFVIAFISLQQSLIFSSFAHAEN
jgi:hypothetical protein